MNKAGDGKSRHQTRCLYDYRVKLNCLIDDLEIERNKLLETIDILKLALEHSKKDKAVF